jgi:phage protein D
MAGESKDVTSCIVKFDGQQKLSSTTGGESTETPLGTLESLRVDLRLDAPGMFSIELDLRSDAVVTVLDALAPGKAVEILLGEVGQETGVLKGEIHYVEPHFRFDGVSTVSLGGYDHSHRLTRGTRSRTWGDGAQASEHFPSVVRDVIQQSGSSLSPEVDSVKTKVTYVPQLNTSDYQMLQWLAQRGGKDVNADVPNDDRKVRFKAPDLSATPIATLVRESPRGEGEEAVTEARFSMSTVRQVDSVVVRGWDALNKKAIVGTANAPSNGFGGTPGHQLTSRALGVTGQVLNVVDQPVDSQEEAEALAQSLFDRLSMDFLTGEVDLPGNPKIVPGVLVQMRGFGTHFDGKYLVTEAAHELVPKGSGYVTRVKIARNDAPQG